VQHLDLKRELKKQQGIENAPIKHELEWSEVLQVNNL